MTEGYSEPCEMCKVNYFAKIEAVNHLTTNVLLI